MRNCKDLNIYYQVGNLDVTNNKLNSLDGCPEHITGWFHCDINKLTSLIGGPQKVDGSYSCEQNQLTDLIGCASHIGGTLICTCNNITSLVGIHKIIKSCKLIWFDVDKIIEGGIGLLLIDNLNEISTDTESFHIISKYLGTGTKGLLKCQNELIKNGFINHAKL